MWSKGGVLEFGCMSLCACKFLPYHLFCLCVVFHVRVRVESDLHREDFLHDPERLVFVQGFVLGLVLLKKFAGEIGIK